MRSWLFSILLVVSFVLAFAQMREFAVGASFPDVYKISACWLLLFVAGLISFRKRALWLLLSAPFAFLPAILIWFYSYECMREHSCL